MSHRAASRLAWSAWALVLALDVATSVFGVIAGKTEGGEIATFAVAYVVFQIFATVGAVVASRRPKNPIGWLFLTAALLMMTANLVGAYAELGTARSLPGTVPAAVGLGWTWVVGLGLLLILVVLFPDGRVPSPRWRTVTRLAVLWLAAVALTSVFRPGQLEEPLEAADNPVGIPGVDVANGVLLIAGVLLMSLAAIGSLAYRFRRAPEQRQQIKWFLVSVGFVLVFDVSFSVADALSSSFKGGPDALWLAVLATVPISVGVAILRYRLYDIDGVVNRTLVYGSLTALLAGAYFGFVLFFQLALSPVTEGNELGVAGSTLAVAALFRPARRRIQEVVDRRFYRRRYDAARTLETFSVRLRAEIDLDALRAALTSGRPRDDAARTRLALAPGG